MVCHFVCKEQCLRPVRTRGLLKVLQVVDTCGLLLAVPGQDFLHQDLNNRLLAAHRGPESGPLPPSPFLRTAAEAAAHNHHQHMHNHQHMHQHNSFNGLGQPSSLVPTPPPHLVSGLVIDIVTTVVIAVIIVVVLLVIAIIIFMTTHEN